MVTPAPPLLSASYVQQSATGRRTQVPTRPDATCICMASMARSLSLRSATAIASSSAKTVVAAAVNVHAVTIELVTTLTEITIELTGGDHSKQDWSVRTPYRLRTDHTPPNDLRTTIQTTSGPNQASLSGPPSGPIRTTPSGPPSTIRTTPSGPPSGPSVTPRTDGFTESSFTESSFAREGTRRCARTCSGA